MFSLVPQGPGQQPMAPAQLAALLRWVFGVWAIAESECRATGGFRQQKTVCVVHSLPSSVRCAEDVQSCALMGP
jgi:hypothetical protein